MSSSAFQSDAQFVRFAARFASACTTGAFAADLRRLRADRLAAGVESTDDDPAAEVALRPDATRAA